MVGTTLAALGWRVGSGLLQQACFVSDARQRLVYTVNSRRLAPMSLLVGGLQLSAMPKWIRWRFFSVVETAALAVTRSCVSLWLWLPRGDRTTTMLPYDATTPQDSAMLVGEP
jgi:hypothetical protein